MNSFFNLPVRRFWIFELLYPPIVLPSLKIPLIEIDTYIEIQPNPYLLIPPDCEKPEFF